MKGHEARAKLRALQALSPKEMEVAAAIIKALDKVPKNKRGGILIKAFNKAQNTKQ